MKRLVDIVQVIALLAAAVTVIALFANQPDEATPATAIGAGAAPDGAAVYAARCASCHGADGGGNVGPALGGGAVVENYPDEADQVAVITEGRSGMPSFGGALSAEEIQAVTSYTRNEL